MRKIFPHAHQNGFTLLEILLVIGILVIVSAATAGYYRNFSKFVELESASKILISDLNNARTKSTSGESERRWGIHLVNQASGNDYYELFSTPSTYTDAAVTIVSTIFIPAGMNFGDPTSGNTKNITFEKISGQEITGVSQTITMQFENQTKTIAVSSLGTVELDPVFPPIVQDSAIAAAGGNVDHVLGYGSGTNRLVLVLLAAWSGGDPFVGVTYNGTPMTLLSTQGSAPAIARIYYLDDASLPATAGTYAVSVTGGGDSSVHAISFTNVDQTTPLGTPVDLAGNTTSPSVTLASSAGELVVDIVSAINGAALTPGAGQTQQTTSSNGNSQSRTSTKAGATSVDMSWSWPVGDTRNGMIGVSIHQAQ